MARLPQPGGDDGNWGTILNDYLLQAHAPDGTLKADSIVGPTIKNSTITEDKLDPAIVAKLNQAGTGGTVNWTAEAQAKAQGYWVVFSETPPTETEMYGVPVIWGRREGMSQPIPVAPTPPSFDLTSRTVTVPDMVGLRYKMGGTPISGRTAMVADGRGLVVVSAEALPGYTIIGVNSWTQSISGPRP